MLIQENKWYATQRGRVVGPVQRMNHAITETYWHDNYFETGIWDRFGRCSHPETRTGYSYGNLVCETVEPKQEEILL
jgi:hypothetical protein